MSMGDPRNNENLSKYKLHLRDGRDGLTEYSDAQSRKRLRRVPKMYREPGDAVDGEIDQMPLNSDQLAENRLDPVNVESDEIQEENLLLQNSDQLPEEIESQIRNYMNLREVEKLVHYAELPDYNRENDDHEIDQEKIEIEEYVSHEHAAQDLMHEMECMVESMESENEDARSKNVEKFEKFLEDPTFFESIQKQVNRSPAEVILMILTFSLQAMLPFSQMSMLCRLINSLFHDDILPESKYDLDKIFNRIDHCEFHAVCPECSIYVGQLKNNKDSMVCKKCGVKMDLSNPSCLNFFLIIDPTEYIAEYLKKNENYYVDVMNGKYGNNENIQDIYDGQYYKNFVQSLSEKDRQNYVSAIFNTDGAPRFESSQFSIWPIYLQINEIPPQERLRCAIPTALYFGDKKPEMMFFLDPFVKMMNRKSIDGFQVTIKEQTRLIKLYPVVGCADAVARAPMQGMMQFNGYYGCGWCKHKGKHDGSMRYPIKNLPEPALRDHQSHLDAAELASTPNPPANTCLFGVKYLSPLAKLERFDIIRGFAPDYMHFYVMGVASQFTEYYVGKLSKDNIKILDKIMNSFAVPNQICRLSRPISQRSHWKAKEWENWVLYYSLPILNLILTDRALKHWSLLVDSLHILLSTNISREQLNQVEQNLKKFVVDAEDIYTHLVLTNNVHQLLHVCQSVRDWGPVWAHSNFVFESANAVLLKSIHAAKGVNLQIVRYINLQHSLRILRERVYPECDHAIKKYCEGIQLSRVKKTFKMSNIRYFGKTVAVEAEYLETNNLSVLRSNSFTKIVKNGTMYSKKVNKRSCNSYALLHDGRFVKCLNFIVDTENNKEITLCNIVQTTHNVYSEHILKVTMITPIVQSIETADIKKVCVFLQVGKQKYICPVANTFYY